MALVLVKEDGTGRVDANSYATLADGDAYHEGHLYPAPWFPAPFQDNREAALVMATRLIDAYCEFLGTKKSATQALQWPRVGVVDREFDAAEPGIGLMRRILPLGPVYLSADLVPACVVQATCELARELLKADRTGTPLGEGLKSQAVSGSTFVFDKLDRKPVLTRTVEALLARVLAGSPGRSAVRILRV